MCLTKFVPFTSSALIKISPSYETACSVRNTKTVNVVSYTPRPSIADDSDWEIDSLILSSDKTLVAGIFKSDVKVWDVKVWDIKTGDSIFHLGNNHRDQKFAGRPSLSPNLQHIQLPMTGDGFFNHSGQVLSSFRTSVEACSEIATGPFLYTATSYQGIAFSPDGSLIALAYRDTTRICKLDTHVTTHTIQTPDKTHNLMFSSDSKLLAILSYKSSNPGGMYHQGNLLYVFDIEMADMVMTIKPLGAIEKIVEICPRLGLVVLSSSSYNEDGVVQIIDIKRKEVKHHFTLGQLVFGVSFDSSYTTCIWSGVLHTLALSKVSTGQILTHVEMAKSITRFNLTAGSDLASTNIGDIQLNCQKRDSCLDECNRVGLGLSEDMSWILWNNTKLF